MIAVRKIAFFIIFELFFCTLLGVILIFHGPFSNIRDTFVTSAMTTMNHQYLARLFVSQKEIDRIMKANQSGIITENENQAGIVPDTTDSNVSLVDIRTSRFRGYLMVVDNPSQVRVGTSDNTGGGGMTLSGIVKKYGASGGINAGGFANDIGGNPVGILIENGRTIYRDNSGKYNLIGFNEKNVLVVGNFSLKQIENMKIRDAVSFGPSLIVNGRPMIVRGDGGRGIQPRTAIGQRRDGAVLFLVIDGREKDSLGATLRDAQDVLLKYGAYNAANLDGGSSATMYYGDKLINKPSDILGERALPSAFIIKGES